MQNKIIGKSGPVLVVVLTLIPIMLWVPHANFSNSSRLWLSLGQVTAIAGFVLYCLNFVLSARLKIIEPFFAGINRAYIWHHLFGATALILLLYHPLLISVSYLAISLQAAAALLWPSLKNLPIYFGSLALIITIVLLFLTLYVKLEYDFWKKTHQYLGAALFLACLHVFLIGSTVAENPTLKFYLLTLATLAICSFLYRTLLGRWLVKRKDYTVAKHTKIDKDVLDLELEPVSGKAIPFIAGQFIFVQPDARGIAKQYHPFSLTSKEGSVNLSVGIKAVGDFTETLKLLEPGAKVKVEGPFGRFSYHFYPSPRQVWIAGGIGVTPFVSLAKSLPKENFEVDFYYAVKDEKEAVYKEVFEETAKENPKFKFHLHCSKDKGRLSADIIAKDINELAKAEIFVCGPPPMMKSMKEQMVKLKVPKMNMHSEEFALN